MQSDAHGYASRRSAPISLPQIAHVPYVPSSIRFSATSISIEHLLGVLAERVVDLAAERCRRGVADVIVALAGISSTSSSSEPGWLSRRFAIAPPRARALRAALRGTIRCRCSCRGPFVPRSCADADASRRSTSAGPSPVSSTILSRPLWPETSVSALRGTGQRLREQPDHRVVRAAALGRRGDAHLPRVAVPADNCSAAGAGTDAQPQASGRRRHAPSVLSCYAASRSPGQVPWPSSFAAGVLRVLRRHRSSRARHAAALRAGATRRSDVRSRRSRRAELAAPRHAPR